MVTSFSLAKHLDTQKYFLPPVPIDANKRCTHNVATEKNDK